MKEIYESVTSQIIEKLKEGVVPWKVPYSRAGNEITNLATKREYHGANVFLLGMKQWAKGYSSPWWLGFRQAKKLGGHVRKGEKATQVIVPFIKEDEDGTQKVVGYGTGRVFNAEQCELPEGTVPEPAEMEDHDPIPAAEEILATRGDLPHVNFIEGVMPCYIPSMDVVNTQPIGAFESAEEYYSTLFHELTHATGHESRLNRKLSGRYAVKDYSFEELIAEMGSTFLAAKAGFSELTIDNSASYISSWLEVLGSNPDWIVKAAAQAQKAADWISTPAKHESKKEAA